MTTARMQQSFCRTTSRLQARFASGWARTQSIPCHILASSSPPRLLRIQGSSYPIKQTCQRQKSHSSKDGSSFSLPAKERITASGIIGCAVLALVWNLSQPVQAEAPPDVVGRNKIRLQEVKDHGKDAARIWVHRGTKVYDITEWIPNHPGGEVILRAAGGSIDPFWKIFSIHNKQDVYDILEQYAIGEIDPRDLIDGKVPEDNIEDPFKNDPERDEKLYVHTARPCNAETPTGELLSYITPNETFYVRNHMWVPNSEDKQHRLTVELIDGTEVEYTMDELRKKFKEYTITAVLQCSGNRRSHMTANCSQGTNGLQWGIGAIGNATWSGVRLRDVLQDAGVDVDELPEEVKHAQFTGIEAYGASIPIEKAVEARGDVLLAYKMNGKTLPRDHGYPLRVIVPGTVAARSVKWVNRVTLSDEESWSQWQRKDYKCFGPNIGKNPDWDSAVSIQEMPVQSAVTNIKEERDSKGGRKGKVTIDGYAFSGGGRKVVRVDISADGGKTWDQAELLEGEVQGSKSWSWQRWMYQIPKERIRGCVTVKAIDEAYNTQPDTFDSHYNFRGNLASGWHRVPHEVAFPETDQDKKHEDAETKEARQLERHLGKKA